MVDIFMYSDTFSPTQRATTTPMFATDCSEAAARTYQMYCEMLRGKAGPSKGKRSSM